MEEEGEKTLLFLPYRNEWKKEIGRIDIRRWSQLVLLYTTTTTTTKRTTKRTATLRQRGRLKYYPIGSDSSTRACLVLAAEINCRNKEKEKEKEKAIVVVVVVVVVVEQKIVWIKENERACGWPCWFAGDQPNVAIKSVSHYLFKVTVHSTLLSPRLDFDGL